LKLVAKQTGFKPGVFSHTLVDAHVYCGNGERGEWYAENMNELQERLSGLSVEDSADNETFVEIREWIEDTAPPEPEDMKSKDHVPGLLTQLSRDPQQPPQISFEADSIDEMTADGVTLTEYDSHDGISFGVAE
jgi:thymidylate synthase